MEGRYIDRVTCETGVLRGSYLWNVPAARWLLEGNALHFPKAVTFLAGENGAGKSTLLEAIAVACGFNPEGGTKNFNFSTRASHSPLWEYLTISRTRHERDGFFLRAEGFYNLATNIEEMDEQPAFSAPIIESYGGRSLHEQSHGESFLAAVQNRFGGRGLYLLDEPEAALSPMKLMTLLCEIRRLVKADSQLVIATHSPILMAYPDAEILWCDERGITSVPYESTEHYRVTQLFLQNPQRMLRQMFAEEGSDEA